MNSKHQKRIRRHNRVRAKISGTATRPRLSVYRSIRHTHLQLIDDIAQKTMLSSSTRSAKVGQTKLEKAMEAGKLLAKKAQETGIKEVVFDRGGYKYHGRVAEIAKVIRDSGIKV